MYVRLGWSVRSAAEVVDAEIHFPRRSSGVLVLVEDSAQSVPSADCTTFVAEHGAWSIRNSRPISPAGTSPRRPGRWSDLDPHGVAAHRSVPDRR